jgi:hypothetical protein
LFQQFNDGNNGVLQLGNRKQYPNVVPQQEIIRETLMYNIFSSGLVEPQTKYVMVHDKKQQARLLGLAGIYQ